MSPSRHEKFHMLPALALLLFTQNGTAFASCLVLGSMNFVLVPAPSTLSPFLIEPQQCIIAHTICYQPVGSCLVLFSVACHQRLKKGCCLCRCCTIHECFCHTRTWGKPTSCACKTSHRLLMRGNAWISGSFRYQISLSSSGTSLCHAFHIGRLYKLPDTIKSPPPPLPSPQLIFIASPAFCHLECPQQCV